MAFGAVAGFSDILTFAFATVGLLCLFAIRWRWLFACAACCVAGLVCGLVTAPNPLPSANTRFNAVVIDEPTVTDDTFVVRVDRASIRVTGVSAPLAFADLVSLSCTAWTWQSVFSDPQCRGSGLRVIQHGYADPVHAGLHAVRVWFERSISRVLPSPEAPFLAGLLLGSRTSIPSSIVQAFQRTGTSHIVAVSGYNVTVVVTLIAAIVGMMPVPRTARLSMTLAAIIAFVILTGASASVVRAGIMGSIVLLCRFVGRVADVRHILLLTCVVMIVCNPAMIADIGFQLSVAATLGLIMLSDPFERRLQCVPQRFGIRSSLSSTLAAIVMTQPLITLYFSQVALVAPLANMIVLPLIPVSMLAGFCIVIMSSLLSVIGPLVGWIAWLPLATVIALVCRGAQLPYASLPLNEWQAVAIASVTAVLAWYLTMRLQRGTSRA